MKFELFPTLVLRTLVLGQCLSFNCYVVPVSLCCLILMSVAVLSSTEVCWLPGQDFGSDCTSSWSFLQSFYFYIFTYMSFILNNFIEGSGSATIK